ncbi:MAG: hypothetical protein QM503_14825 [Bacteroidota bacterium]
MKQAALLFTLIIIMSFSVFTQTIVLEGKQTMDSNNKSPSLKCVPVKITKSMKITAVEGMCEGFWIEKGSVTVHKFKNTVDAVGTTLAPGTYYVYPNVKKDMKKADVSITLKAPE